MSKSNARVEFFTLLGFIIISIMLISNGFVARINAQEDTPDVYREIEPIGDVLDKILDGYVRDVELDAVVEGALKGMMQSLDRNSDFISKKELVSMKEDTSGEFEGVGISIRKDDNGKIIVYMPVKGSPAAEAGLLPFDEIFKIDDVPTEGMELGDVADKIRGPRGTTVKITVLRFGKEGEDPKTLDFDIKRGKVPLESVKEARMLDNGIGYARVSDFKDHTSDELEERIKSMLDQGMTAFILDLRWNPGGLLTSSQETCELFLPKGKLVTYTRGRKSKDGSASRDDLQLFTEKNPILPPEMPLIVLANENSASSSEIVTGALQFYQRAIVLGEKTFGKGSVQTIIPLTRPEQTALRLTTALYYTPAEVTIDGEGIQPDVHVPMTLEQQRSLGEQMYESYKDDPGMVDEQNHGTVTGAEENDDLVEDVQLKRAVEILLEDSVFDNLLKKYHRDVSETQVAKSDHVSEEVAPSDKTSDETAEASPEEEPVPAEQ